MLATFFVAEASLEVPKNFQGGQHDYSQAFFEQHRQQAAIYSTLAHAIRAVLGITLRDTVDVGCGHGLLVEAWRSLEVESFGIEGSANAVSMWPTQFVAKYYQVQDLTTATAHVVPKTDLVTTFEVAEHLPPEKAGHFVSLLTSHSPKAVVFGAATPFQDQGKNPSHVNENTFAYWIEHFRDHGYIVDWAKTAKLRHVLLSEDMMKQHFANCWWYPKNTLIFVPRSQEKRLQEELAALDDAMVDMFQEGYLTYPVKMISQTQFHSFWKRDWLTFASHFHSERAYARVMVDRRREDAALKSSCNTGNCPA